MTTATIDAFWKQLATSGMVEADRVAQLAHEFAVSQGTVGGGSIQDLTAWMINQQILTRDQCRTLLKQANQSIAPPPFAPPIDPEAAQAASVRNAAASAAAQTSSTAEASAPSAASRPAQIVSEATPRLSDRYESKSGGKSKVLLAVGAGAALLIAGVCMSLLMNGEPETAVTPEDVVTNNEAPTAETSPQENTTADASSPDTNTASEAATKSPPKKPAVASPLQEEDVPKEAGPKEITVADDGETLWKSPTSGEPPTLRHVPLGTQIIFTLRPSELLTSDEGPALLRAIGPGGEAFASFVSTATGHKLSDIDRLDIMLGEAESDDSSLLAIVAYPATPSNDDNHQPSPPQHLQLKAFSEPDRLVVASEAVLAELEELGSSSGSGSAPLSPPMQQLFEQVDGDRHCNIVFTPSFVRGTRESLYSDDLAPLRGGIDWMLGTEDDVQAGLLSFHLDEQLFTELRLFGLRDVLPQILARRFSRRIAQTPRQVKEHLKTLSLHAYSRDVLWDFPDMLQSVSRYTRHDREGRQGVVRCYLPATAASHLAAAIELTLWETSRAGAGEGTPAASPVARRPQTLEERLKQPTSLSFDRSSLEKSLQTLSEDLGIRIVILGRDLQLDGITKNQSFGIDLRNRPAREILNTIVQLANPDKTATKLSDDAQKLIYVLKPNYENGEDAIVITTRAQAVKRQDTLPAEFTAP